jgi:hypothetical protein
MGQRLSYGTVRESRRRAIYVLRVWDEILEPSEIADLAERMREWLEHRGELTAEVVVMLGDSRQTLRLLGNPYSTARVRAALFNAEVSWMPIKLG